eukprot:1288929-Rhodomonas_salina.1
MAMRWQPSDAEHDTRPCSNTVMELCLMVSAHGYTPVQSWMCVRSWPALSVNTSQSKTCAKATIADGHCPRHPPPAPSPVGLKSPPPPP